MIEDWESEDVDVNAEAANIYRRCKYSGFLIRSLCMVVLGKLFLWNLLQIIIYQLDFSFTNSSELVWINGKGMGKK